jgi:PadR family transcriptional regulator, regulatory protein PadR
MQQSFLNQSQNIFTTNIVNININTTFVVNIIQMSIGEFEELVLLIVAVMNGKAYGISIIDELEKRTGRSAAIGAVQTALKRMEEKGWVTSEFGEATKERGGKRKRYYTITRSGQKALTQRKEQRISLWDAIPKLGWKYATN